MNNRIKELRARYDLTQNDLAVKANVRRETIVFLEKGKYNPSLQLAYDISRVFESTIEEVFLQILFRYAGCLTVFHEYNILAALTCLTDKND